MPKLAAKDRKKVAKAEATSGEFEPMPPGKYVATLKDVEAKTSGAGNSYWNAEFEEIHDLDGERFPGRQWYMIMLPIDSMPDDYVPGKNKKAGTKPTKAEQVDAWDKYQGLTAGRIKAFFEAFGFSEDSDTDEMIGERCVLQIGVETINQGPRTGQQTNRVNAVFPLTEDLAEVGADGGSSDDF